MQSRSCIDRVCTVTWDRGSRFSQNIRRNGCCCRAGLSVDITHLSCAKSSIVRCCGHSTISELERHDTSCGRGARALQVLQTLANEPAIVATFAPQHGRDPALPDLHPIRRGKPEREPTTGYAQRRWNRPGERPNSVSVMLSARTRQGDSMSYMKKGAPPQWTAPLLLCRVCPKALTSCPSSCPACPH